MAQEEKKLEIEGEVRNGAVFSFADYLQLACMTRRSVHLSAVLKGEKLGGVVIVNGEIWHAWDTSGEGVSAFKRLALLECEVTVLPQKEPVAERTIHSGWERLIMDAAAEQGETGTNAAASLDSPVASGVGAVNRNRSAPHLPSPESLEASHGAESRVHSGVTSVGDDEAALSAVQPKRREPDAHVEKISAAPETLHSPGKAPAPPALKNPAVSRRLWVGAGAATLIVALAVWQLASSSTVESGVDQAQSPRALPAPAPVAKTPSARPSTSEVVPAPPVPTLRMKPRSRRIVTRRTASPKAKIQRKPRQVAKKRVISPQLGTDVSTP